jgi:hypothetical protein
MGKDQRPAQNARIKNRESKYTGDIFTDRMRNLMISWLANQAWAWFYSSLLLSAGHAAVKFFKSLQDKRQKKV